MRMAEDFTERRLKRIFHPDACCRSMRIPVRDLLQEMALRLRRDFDSHLACPELVQKLSNRARPARGNVGLGLVKRGMQLLTLLGIHVLEGIALDLPESLFSFFQLLIIELVEELMELFS